VRLAVASSAEAEAGVAHRPAGRERRIALPAFGDGGHEGGVRERPVS